MMNPPNIVIPSEITNPKSNVFLSLNSMTMIDFIQFSISRNDHLNSSDNN